MPSGHQGPPRLGVGSRWELQGAACDSSHQARAPAIVRLVLAWVLRRGRATGHEGLGAVLPYPGPTGDPREGEEVP